MKKSIDLMLDLETFGTVSNAAIIQISAVPFHLDGTAVDYHHFDALVNPTSSVKAGLKVDGGAVEFWLKQDSAVIEKVLIKSIQEGKQLSVALMLFTDYVEEIKKALNVKDVFLWGNGIKADNNWLESAYRSVGKEYPVSFRQDMDVRTLVRIGRERGIDFKDKIPFEGNKHNALDDCRWQIKYLQATYDAMFGIVRAMPAKPSEQ